MKTVNIEVMVPMWAKWLAQDLNGNWYIYENKPKVEFESYWKMTGLDTSARFEVITEGVPNQHWKETLVEIEE